MNMILKKINNENGVIMIESLIMLPVYFVILAGVFWIGEMCLIHQTLNTAERLRIWESGPRYSAAAEIEASDIFAAFCETTGTMVTNTRQKIVTGVSDLEKKSGSTANDFQTTMTTNDWGDNYSWGVIKSGFVLLKTRRSAWSWGIVDFSRNSIWSFLGAQTEASQVAAGRDVVTMLSRGDKNGNSLSSVILFRNKDSATDKRKISVFSETDWNTIYSEKWSDFIKPESSFGKMEKVSSYNRLEAYKEWSE